jgi:hypothetical protein
MTSKYLVLTVLPLLVIIIVTTVITPYKLPLLSQDAFAASPSFSRQEVLGHLKIHA